ncbi:hypothetical protein LR48_Vigan07g134100 [Vigna angularis]|uniref:Uncharacterized protein n=1 Tax=Phaseolus angularis TaxID=3914 RepID=A0A0L9UYH8_PHAAN|nr:hypothetical protein LR48_Vigan07g134100 [Vigna angularis]
MTAYHYVRGHAIRYDPDSISNFLDTVWAGEQCQFALCMEEGADFDDVNLVKEVKKDRDGIRKDIKKCKRRSRNYRSAKSTYGHPSLITHLCELAWVNISAPPFERPRKAIDEAYYRQYCGDAQMQSIHRGQVAIAEMIIGMYDTSLVHRWTMDEIHNVVAWPKEQTQELLNLLITCAEKASECGLYFSCGKHGECASKRGSHGWLCFTWKMWKMLIAGCVPCGKHASKMRSYTTGLKSALFLAPLAWQASYDV